MDASLSAMLTEQVTYQHYTGQDGYGTPTFDAPLTVPARVEYTQRRIVTAEGQERLSQGKVFLGTLVVQELRDKVVLPDGTAPALLRLYTVRDEVGVFHHQEIFI